jgi:hypothetical protein
MYLESMETLFDNSFFGSSRRSRQRPLSVVPRNRLKSLSRDGPCTSGTDLVRLCVIERHQDLAWSMYRHLKVNKIPIPEWKQLWFSRFLAMRKFPFEAQEVLLHTAYLVK